MSSFKFLVAKDHFLTIHEKNVQYLSVEAFKVKMGLCPVIMKEIFQYTENPVYELWSGNDLRRVNIRTVCFSTESIVNLGTKILNMIPEEIKASNTLGPVLKVR